MALSRCITGECTAEFRSAMSELLVLTKLKKFGYGSKVNVDIVFFFFNTHEQAYRKTSQKKLGELLNDSTILFEEVCCLPTLSAVNAGRVSKQSPLLSASKEHKLTKLHRASSSLRRCSLVSPRRGKNTPSRHASSVLEASACYRSSF